MNVPDGFSGGLSFYYSSITFSGSVDIYDGLDGTGNLLASINLSVTPSDGGNPTGPFSPFVSVDVDFAGTALSVEFGGTASQIGYDDVALGLVGDDGDDTLIGGAGDDTLVGGGGSDTSAYSGAQTSVIVSLANGVAKQDGDGGTDVLIGIENIVGSGFDDELTGDDKNNALDGGARDDILVGGAGTDTLTGGAGSDTFSYASVTDGGPSGDLVTDFESGIDRFEFDVTAFGDALEPDGTVNFLRVGPGADYDGTNATGQAAFVFEVDERGVGGILYYDPDPVDPGYAIVANVQGDEVTEPDITIV